jgi:hypothetical protein
MLRGVRESLRRGVRRESPCVCHRDECRDDTRCMWTKATKRTLWPNGRSTARRDRQLDVDWQPAPEHGLRTRVLAWNAGNVVTAVDACGSPHGLAVSYRRRRLVETGDAWSSSVRWVCESTYLDQIPGRILGQRGFFDELRNFATLASAHRSEDYEGKG